MISYKGVTSNQTESRLCRVALNSDRIISDKFDFLFINKIEDFNKKGYAGFIVCSSEIKLPIITDFPVLQLDKDIPSFDDGDVFIIEPEGYVTKIYEKRSSTNALLLTEKCNCNCLMCPQPPKKQDDDISVGLAIESIELMDKNTECLGITGGEPTLDWDRLIHTIKKCREFLPNTQIQLLTNARVLKDYKKAKELVTLGGNALFLGIPIYSDVDVIHDKLCGVKGSFWNSIEGVYNLEREGAFVELRTVITKENYQRLPNFAEFVYRTMPFVGYVAFMGMEPIGKALKNIKRLWVDPVDYSDSLESAVKILSRRDIGTYLFNHQLCTIPKNLWGLAKKTISEWKIIYMDECEKCTVREDCGGFFFSANNYKSRGISPIL